MTLDFLVDEGLTDFQKALQRALSELPHRPSEMADVARLRSGLSEVLALLNYERADAPVRGLDGPLAQEIDSRVVATRNGFEVIHLHLPRLRASVERPAVERVIRQHPQSMIVATSSDPSDEGAWHFVNVKEAGQGRKVLRRAVAEPPTVGRTVLETLSQCQVQANQSALDIEIAHDRAFDVEAVSKRFYIEYATQFEQLRNELQTIHGVSKETADGEVQDLLNRLIFLMFIQRKSWLPTPENPDRNILWTEFTQSHRADPSSDSYHVSFLHPLFLALSRRKEPHARRGLPSDVKQVPFLNGGLFDLDDDSDVLTLPNSAFEGLFKNLLLRYNFTIREDTPLEVEVAIDPEMLGRVFENLILQLEKTGDIDPRKATGSYYTPRPIVHFMCQQALKEWIAGQSIIDSQAIDELIQLLQSERMGPEERQRLQSIMSEGDAERLREHILDIAVVDPAVGSGAFLLGMLHEMLAMVRLLDLLLLGQDEIDRRNYDYEKKHAIIERCLYGVDIQARAVRICELRLWLSLVVDYVLAGGESPPTLPNLTYRVVQGDSLIEHLLGHEVRWAGEPRNDRERQLVDTIQAAKDAHFFKGDPQEKHQLEVSIIRDTADLAREILSHRDRESQIELGATVTTEGPDPLIAEIDLVIQSSDELARKGAINAEDIARLRKEMKQTFVWRLDFAEVFRRKGGFDIAIANPPYVRQEAITSMKVSLRESFPSTYNGVADLYVYFYDRSLSILRPGGVLCFISSNKYFRARYGERLRELLSQSSTLTTIVDFGDLPVFDATTYPTVVVAIRGRPSEDHAVRSLTMESLEHLDELASLIDQQANRVPQALLKRTGWVLEDPKVHVLLEGIRRAGTSLGELVGGSIYRGVLTGLNEALIVDDRTRERLISEDSRCSEIIKPYLRGRDVKRWRVTHAGTWLLRTHVGLDISEYEPILRHLEPYKDRLAKRYEAKKGLIKWYELRPCAYYEAFERPKIMYPHNSIAPAYAFDEAGFYCNDKAYIIPTEERWLLAILNSAACEFQMAQMSPALRGGYYEHRVIFVSKLTIPAVGPTERQKLLTYVDTGSSGLLEQEELDRYVSELFGLSRTDDQLIQDYLQRRKRRDLRALKGILAGYDLGDETNPGT